jgi:hypothetical protein
MIVNQQSGETKMNPWIIFNYEVDQLMGLIPFLTEEFKAPGPIKNAVTEAAILHVRLISEMLREAPLPRTDDVALPDLVGSYRPPDLAAFNRAFRTRNSGPRQEINSRLIHLSKCRTDNYDYTPILQTLLPLLDRIIRDLRDHAI